MGLFDKIKGATDKIKNAAKSVVDKAGSALDERTIRKNNEMLKYGEYVCDFENCRGDFQSDVDVRKNEKGLFSGYSTICTSAEDKIFALSFAESIA